MTKILPLVLLALAPLARADYDVLFDATVTKGGSVNVAHLEGPLDEVPGSTPYEFSNGNPEVGISLFLSGPRQLQVDALLPNYDFNGNGVDAYEVSGRLVYRQKVRLIGAGREGIHVPVRTLDLGNLGSLSRNGVAQTEMIVGEEYDLKWGFDFSQSETAPPGQKGTLRGQLRKSLVYGYNEDQGGTGSEFICPIFVNPYWIDKLSLESEANMVLRPDAALPVPEPATLAILGAGALGLRRRRRG